VIEAAVFLHDEDEVLDLFEAGRNGRSLTADSGLRRDRRNGNNDQPDERTREGKSPPFQRKTSRSVGFSLPAA
jgi:hypothetical protein